MLGGLVRRITAGVYQRVIKPILFRQSPDEVHARMIRMAMRSQSMPLIKSLPKLWRHDDVRLEQTVFGLQFKNPIGLSAGLDKNGEILPMVEAIGFGFATCGSVTARACDGNPRPWYHRLPKTKSLVVYAGLPNQGVTAIVERLQNYMHQKSVHFPLVVSVAKTNNCDNASDQEAIADYCESLQQLEAAGVCQIYELNISCPNTYGGEPFTTPERLEQLLSAVDELKLSKPVTIKMPIDHDWREFKALLEVIVDHNIQAVTIGNLLKDRTRAQLSDELPDTVQGSLSGQPTRDISTALILQTYKAYGHKLKIIGVGGVSSAVDAYLKIRAGATLVELITGLIYEGPQLIGDINAELAELLRRDGHNTVAEAIGVDTKGV